MNATGSPVKLNRPKAMNATTSRTSADCSSRRRMKASTSSAAFARAKAVADHARFAGGVNDAAAQMRSLQRECAEPRAGIPRSLGCSRRRRVARRFADVTP